MIRFGRGPLILTALVSVAVLPVAGCEGCSTAGVDGGVLDAIDDGFVGVFARSETSVEVRFSRAIDAAALSADRFAIVNYTEVPPAQTAIESASLDGDKAVTLTTAALVPGETYTLEVTDLKDSAGGLISGTMNFTAGGAFDTVDVTFVIDDVEVARAYGDLTLLVTADADTGAFSEQLDAYPIVDEGDRFAATLAVAADPNRTLSRADDADPRVDRRAYGARVVDDMGRMVSPLVLFVVPDATPGQTVAIDVVPPPEVQGPAPTDTLPPAPVDENVGDGLKAVRIVVDDRAARELVNPELKLAVNNSGEFDPSFPRVVALAPLDGEFAGYWDATIEVKVDPNRTEDGDSLETFPYLVYLVVDGVEYEGLNLSLVAPDETPETVRLSLGNAEWTPVTFRVDVSGAYVNPDGSVRGTYPGEAVFLTGEWQIGVDALGNNCGDSFSGGETLCMRMREDPAHAGVWTRTVWLPPGRPYGWKVVRCDATTGCGPLNALVSSAGRAFATVMKNLVTDNADAFADSAVGLIDPLNFGSVEAGGQTWDYSDAEVYVGTEQGSEIDPAGTPDGERMFKQEVPDLVVVVGPEPVVTRVYHVATWRDVNLGQAPSDIVENSSTVDLNPFDYDDGFIGRYPPSREAP